MKALVTFLLAAGVVAGSWAVAIEYIRSQELRKDTDNMATALDYATFTASEKALFDHQFASTFYDLRLQVAIGATEYNHAPFVSEPDKAKRIAWWLVQTSALAAADSVAQARLGKAAASTYLVAHPTVDVNAIGNDVAVLFSAP